MPVCPFQALPMRMIPSSGKRIVARPAFARARRSTTDIPLSDRLFGTYKDTTAFAPRCGFPQGAESKLISMLAFKDVY